MRYIFKSIVYVLVFSLLNLQFSSLAYGMKGQGGRIVSADEEYIGKNGGSAIRLSELRKTDTLTQPLHDQQHGNASLSQILPTEEIKEPFKAVLRSFVEKLHADEDRSPQTRRLIVGTAAVVALFSSFAIAALFLSDSATLSFLEYPIDDDVYVTVPPFTTTGITAATFAGTLTFPDYYLLLSHALGGGYMPFKNHRLIEEQDILKTIGFYILVGPSIAVLMAKMLYAYIDSGIGGWNVPPLYTAECIAAVPFFSLQLLRDYRSFAVNYRQVYDSLSTKVRTFMGHKPKETDEKKAIRERFAFGMRKLLKDPRKTTELHNFLQALQETVRTQRRPLVEQLTALKAKQKAEGGSAYQAEITGLEAQLLDLEAQETLGFIKLLYTFGQEEEYKPGNAHPWWYYAAQGTGIAGVGGLSSVAVWYAMSFIPHDIGADYSTSYGIGTAASLIAVPFLMDRGRLWLEGTTSLINHYNPVQNENTISSPVVDFSKRRLIVNLLNIIRYTYLMIPEAMVGGNAMYAGVGPIAPPMDWKAQLKFILPSMVGWGAAEHKNTEPRLQKTVSQMTQYFGLHDEKMTQRQEVADWFHRADRWVEKLAGHHVPELEELLNKHQEDVEIGKITADEHGDGSRSTDSPYSNEHKSSGDSNKSSPEGTSSNGHKKDHELDGVHTTLFDGDKGSSSSQPTTSAAVTTTNPLHQNEGLIVEADSDDDV